MPLGGGGVQGMPAWPTSGAGAWPGRGTDKRAAVYLRVSSDKQTTDCQRPDVQRLVEFRGLQVVAEFDEQRSACLRRPGFRRMMEAAQRKEFSILVIWALDRFGRSMAGNLNDVLALDRLGVRVVSVKEPWMDTDGPVRELLIAIFGWVAQHERLRLIERTRAGIQNSKSQGVKWGNASPALLPPDQRPAAIALWEQRGKPSGWTGLARFLGGCTDVTAKRVWLAAQATPDATDSVQNSDTPEPDVLD